MYEKKKELIWFYLENQSRSEGAYFAADSGDPPPPLRSLCAGRPCLLNKLCAQHNTLIYPAGG